MRYAVGGRAIFDGLDLTARRGRITAFMGPSGTGKTTLLRLITGQVYAERGSVRVFGDEVSTMSGKELFALRQRMGMLFQNGALLTDEDVYENVAFPVRAHTRLPESLIRQLVLTKLHAVGPARRRAAHAGGAVRWHAATRGARARHRHGSRNPDLRRAVRRPRSDFDGRDLPPHQADERSAGHHQHRRLARRAGALDHRARQLPAVVGQGRRVRHARGAARAASSKKCGSSWAASPDGPVPFHYPAPDYSQQLLEEERNERAPPIRCRSPRCAASAP